MIKGIICIALLVMSGSCLMAAGNMASFIYTDMIFFQVGVKSVIVPIISLLTYLAAGAVFWNAYRFVKVMEE